VTGNVFFVNVTETTTLAEAKAEIATQLAVSDEQIAKAKFFLGTTYVTVTPKSALADAYVLAQIPPAQTLFVVLDPKKKPTSAIRRREEAVTIHN
jgi:hypothetical protein